MSASKENSKKRQIDAILSSTQQSLKKLKSSEIASFPSTNGHRIDRDCGRIVVQKFVSQKLTITVPDSSSFLQELAIDWFGQDHFYKFLGRDVNFHFQEQGGVVIINVGGSVATDGTFIPLSFHSIDFWSKVSLTITKFETLCGESSSNTSQASNQQSITSIVRDNHVFGGIVSDTRDFDFNRNDLHTELQSVASRLFEQSDMSFPLPHDTTKTSVLSSEIDINNDLKAGRQFLVQMLFDQLRSGDDLFFQGLKKHVVPKLTLNGGLIVCMLTRLVSEYEHSSAQTVETCERFCENVVTKLKFIDSPSGRCSQSGFGGASTQLSFSQSLPQLSQASVSFGTPMRANASNIAFTPPTTTQESRRTNVNTPTTINKNTIYTPNRTPNTPNNTNPNPKCYNSLVLSLFSVLTTLVPLPSTSLHRYTNPPAENSLLQYEDFKVFQNRNIDSMRHIVRVVDSVVSWCTEVVNCGSEVVTGGINSAKVGRNSVIRSPVNNNNSVLSTPQNMGTPQAKVNTPQMSQTTPQSQSQSQTQHINTDSPFSQLSQVSQYSVSSTPQTPRTPSNINNTNNTNSTPINTINSTVNNTNNTHKAQVKRLLFTSIQTYSTILKYLHKACNNGFIIACRSFQHPVLDVDLFIGKLHTTLITSIVQLIECIYSQFQYKKDSSVLYCADYLSCSLIQYLHIYVDKLSETEPFVCGKFADISPWKEIACDINTYKTQLSVHIERMKSVILPRLTTLRKGSKTDLTSVVSVAMIQFARLNSYVKTVSVVEVNNDDCIDTM